MRLGDIELVRVEYFDVALPPSVAGLSAEDVAAVRWATPVWAEPDGNLLIGQAIWIIESAGTVIAVDPCGAADEFLRSGAAALEHQDRVADALRDAGYPVEQIDIVVLTHLDGIGMAAAVDGDGTWTPMFPNARLVTTAAEIAFLDTQTEVMGLDAFAALRRAGAVDAIEGSPVELAPGVHLELTGGHSPGHAVVRIASQGRQAVLVGHLAISPVQLAAVQGPELHLDAPARQRGARGPRGGGAAGRHHDRRATLARARDRDHRPEPRGPSGLGLIPRVRPRRASITCRDNINCVSRSGTRRGPRHRCGRRAGARLGGRPARVGAALRVPRTGSCAQRSPSLLRAPRRTGASGRARPRRGLVARSRHRSSRDGEQVIDDSISAGLRRRRADLTVHELSTRAMLAISHAIEDEYCARARNVGCSSEASSGPTSTNGPRRVGRNSLVPQSITIAFADFDRSIVRRAAPIEVGLRSDAPLLREWSVICDTPGFSACLAGIERPARLAGEGPRTFEALWSLDPEVVRDATEAALTLARKHAPRINRVLQPLPPVATPNSGFLQRASALTSRIVAYLDA